MTTDTFQRDLANDMRGTQQPAQLTQSQQEIPAQVYQQAVQGGDVDALELLPGEQWRDVPYLDKGLRALMIQNEQPFRILYCEATESQFGPIWRYVLDLEGQIFSDVLSLKQDKPDSVMNRVRDVLMAGARSVGPFIIVETDTGMQNPWVHLRPVSKTHQSKMTKPQGKLNAPKRS